MRSTTVTAMELVRVRRRLRLTQAELAERLGVSRRTIIRGEVRGIEVPWWSSSDRRGDVRSAWNELQELAAKADVVDAWAERNRQVRSRRPGGARRFEDPPAGGDTQPEISAEVSPSVTSRLVTAARRDTSAGRSIAKLSRRPRRPKRAISKPRRILKVSRPIARAALPGWPRRKK